MCGFPLMHLDKHLKTLVQGNKRFVAMCEEFPAKGGRKLFDRRVTRVITPGTLIDESFLNPYEDNYLLGIYCDPTLKVIKGDSDASSTPVGLAWIDVSTGEFISKLSSIDQLRDDIERVDPREIVLDSRLSELPLHPIQHILETTEYFVSYTNIYPDIHEATSFNTMEPSQDDDLSSITREDPSNLTFSPFESHAFNLITSLSIGMLSVRIVLLLAADGCRDSQISDQIQVLNNAYNPSGLHFVHAGTTRTTNATWFNQAEPET
ncbi:hypothetical protein ONZ45_g18396 [Pleurotus djamor]|nr:hypothetical protein ONZ45_g18396 [Pleurotus djamor]